MHAGPTVQEAVHAQAVAPETSTTNIDDSVHATAAVPGNAGQCGAHPTPLRTQSSASGPADAQQGTPASPQPAPPSPAAKGPVMKRLEAKDPVMIQPEKAQEKKRKR